LVLYSGGKRDSIAVLDVLIIEVLAVDVIVIEVDVYVKIMAVVTVLALAALVGITVVVKVADWVVV
jgi:hypothetical protein